MATWANKATGASAPNTFTSWTDWQNRIAAAPEATYADGSMYASNDPRGDLERERQNYFESLAFAANPLTIGSPGTSTVYGSFGRGGFGPDFNVSASPFEGGQAFAVRDPYAAGFTVPGEELDRFYKQAFQGGIQEEYVPQALQRSLGADQSTFDYMSGGDPFAADWGLSQAGLGSNPKKWNLIDNVLTNPGMLLMAGGLGLTLGGPALAGALGAEGGGGAIPASQLSSIGPAQGSILPAGVQASGAMTFPVLDPYLGIEAIGAGGAGGAMANELIYSDIGPAQGTILEPGAQASGATTFPVNPNPYAGITATPTGSLWDTAKDLWSKKPPLPSMPGGGAQMEGGGEGDEGMSLWSDFVNPKAFNPVAAGIPQYQAHEATPYGFEQELQRRLALIRGAR